MKLLFSEDQQMFGDAVTAFLRERYDWDSRLKAIKSEDGWRPEVWRELGSELGILGLALGEGEGGLGGGAFDWLAAVEPIGEALVVEPYVEAAVFAGSILAESRTEIARTVATQLAAGNALPVVAWDDGVAPTSIETCARQSAEGYRISGTKRMVVGAPWATHFLVSAMLDEEDGAPASAVFLVPHDAQGLRLRTSGTIDGRRSSDIYLDDIEVSCEALLMSGSAWVLAFEAARDRATIGLCGEAVGILAAMVTQTVAYTHQRYQFGQPLSAFQALQHRMADMKVALEQARAVTLLAAANLDQRPTRRAASVSAAKVQVNKACKLIGQAAVQLHGGMGMTMELPIGHYFRRATVIERTFGTIDEHLLRFGEYRDHGLI